MTQIISIADLKDNPYQPRFNIDVEEQSFIDFVNGIKENGVIQPIKVAHDKSDGKYFIIFGHRRAMACKILGIKEVEAIVSDVGIYSMEARISTLIENIQREDLNPIEIGKAYKDAIESGISLTELSIKLGKRKSDISKSIKCLSLNPKIIAFISQHKSAKKDATILYELAKCVKDYDKQWEIFQIYQKGTSNRIDLLKLIKESKVGKLITKEVDDGLKLSYDHQGIKLRAPFLVNLDKAKKEAFEEAIKEIMDRFRI